jgi:hypothetical protein
MQEVLPVEEDRRRALEAQLSAVRDSDLAGRNARFWTKHNSRLDIKDTCKHAAMIIKTATAPNAFFVLTRQAPMSS